MSQDIAKETKRHEHIVTAVWLRRVGNRAEVLVEIGGEWYGVIQEVADSNYSHIMELKNHSIGELERGRRDLL